MMSPPHLRRTSYHLDLLRLDSETYGIEPACEQTYFSRCAIGSSVDKMFALHVGQEVPMLGQGRTVLPEPSSFLLGHEVVTESVFACEPRTLQALRALLKFLRASVNVCCS